MGSPFTSHSGGRAPEYRAIVPPKTVRRKYESMCMTCGGVALNLRIGNRKGLIWKALVIWKHQVAQIAARHATERLKNKN